jgi:hypothetical protein
VDASHIYWTDVFVGDIRQANLEANPDGSHSPQTLISGQAEPFGLAVGA